MTVDRVAAIVVTALGAHVLLKFAVFFAPYARRRSALDKAYGDKASATGRADALLLVVCAALAALLLARGIEPVSFLGALWIGATLIQVYFHRFSSPLATDRAPPPVVSPIKTMSYAIQDAPWRAWRELVFLALLIAAGLARLWL